MPRLKVNSVEHGKEWWRKRYERTLWHKWALGCMVNARLGLEITIRGSERWPIVVKGSRIYKVRAHGSFLLPSEPVGRFHGKHLVIHSKLAPKWLKNWVKYQPNVYLLDALDKGTLAAHLMKEKLSGE